MKNFKFYFVLLLAFTFVVASCSKDESAMKPVNEKVATLSFGALLNDMAPSPAAAQKQMDELPECSDGMPTTVRAALKDADGNWVADSDGDAGDFIEIPVITNPIESDDGGNDHWITDESQDLELPEGNYTLEYFSVLDEDGDVLWIAPRENDDYGPANYQSFVDDALPISIDLRNGVKKYINVEVLCYDDRNVNEYGYLFFELTPLKAITFCAFGNIIDENGRHFPAHFRLEVWEYSGDPDNPKGNPLFNEDNPYINEVGTNDDGDDYADPLCIVLPDLEGEDQYYAEIYLLDWDNDEDEGELIRHGVFNDETVKDLYDDTDNTTNFYHFRHGSSGEDTPPIFQENDDGNGNGNGGEEPSGDCYVQLFDGDDYSDDNIVVEGPGEFSDLSNLPGADKNWNNEADSFKSGENTTVTFWTETNFQGDSVTYTNGDENLSMDEPRSMKITCDDGDGDGDGNGDGGNPSDTCYIELFDGDGFTDDTIKVMGPGEFSDLHNLPGADGKDWDDEADSFKVGENSKVIVWTETNFEGESITYEAGSEISSTDDEPRSIKIICLD